MKVNKIVCIGGYGHSVTVLDDMVGMKNVSLVACAPAYKGEKIDNVKNHKIFNFRVQIFNEYKEMLNTIKPDITIISTRLDKIPAVTIDAAKAKSHLIVEKPLALDFKTLSLVNKTIKENRVKLMAMLTMRSLPAFIAARKIYKRGDIGEVVIINARKSYKWGHDRPKWFGVRSMYGGTIPWVGIHALDFINYITGLEFTKVAAMHSNYAHSSHKRCEDNCALIYELSNGGHATVSVDFCRPMSASTHGDDWIRIVGTKGVIEANASKEFCEVIKENQLPKKVKLPKNEKIFKNFLTSLAGKSDYHVPEKESFMLTNASLCGRQAADCKKVLQINKNFGYKVI
ncbi:MAG: Gfo/Idh/MocA family oxidoreductase [Phycisphaerales bacterium]